jgi:hypothetical protein
VKLNEAPFIADLKSVMATVSFSFPIRVISIHPAFYLSEPAISGEIILLISIVIHRFSVPCIVQVDSAVNAVDVNMPRYAEGLVLGPLRLVVVRYRATRSVLTNRAKLGTFLPAFPFLIYHAETSDQCNRQYL